MSMIKGWENGVDEGGSEKDRLGWTRTLRSGEDEEARKEVSTWERAYDALWN